MLKAERKCKAIDDWTTESLKRRQKLPLPALQNIKSCLSPRHTVDAVRAETFEAHAELAEHTDSEQDVLLRTNNGSGLYAPSDIDIFVVASNDAEANATMAKLYKLVGEILEEPCTVVHHHVLQILARAACSDHSLLPAFCSRTLDICGFGLRRPCIPPRGSLCIATSFEGIGLQQASWPRCLPTDVTRRREWQLTL